MWTNIRETRDVINLIVFCIVPRAPDAVVSLGFPAWFSPPLDGNIKGCPPYLRLCLLVFRVIVVLAIVLAVVISM